MKAEVAKTKCTGLVVTRPVIVITTLNENGVVNGGAFGAYTNLSPSEIGIAIGKESHTYKNIKRTGEFVINVPGADLVDSLSIFGSNLPSSASEVEKASLTTDLAKEISPPLIKECKANIECRYTKEFPIGYHNFVVGEVLLGYCEKSCLDEDGRLNVLKAGVLHGVKYPLPIYALFGKYVEGK